ncbi:chemotaxis protein CheW [Geminocystis herdmanii]|uniref:chemotaxis protein CheW n=1 Tax=Geminocystis herdmanii TaxID=669359 RepID=UPI00034B7DB3|nr:chemotaxis protein CheW [Geminocystis herdmanii]
MDYFIVELIDRKKVAIPLNQVQEVMNINYSDICPIPGVNYSLLGVTNHRGNFLWILELSNLLFHQSLPNLSLNTLTILLTKIRHNNLGLVVQKLGEIKAFSDFDKSLTDKTINSNYYQDIIPDSQNIPILNLTNIQNSLNS